MRRRCLAFAAWMGALGTAAAGYEVADVRAYSLGGYSAYAAAIGDVTGDGRDDAVLAGIDHFWVFVQLADGSLAPPREFRLPSIESSTVALGDLNRDGIQDIVLGRAKGIAIYASNPIRPLRFTARQVISGQRAWDVAVLDVDRDGNLDVVGQGDSLIYQDTSNNSPHAIAFYGDGAGGIRYTQPLQTNGSTSNDLKTGDLNNDGFPDLAISSFMSSQKVNVRYHDGISGYTAPLAQLDPRYDASSYLYALAIGDFNGDGRNDLAASESANSPRSRVSILFQQSDGQFLTPRHFPSYDMPGPMVSTDLDGDGRTDLVVLHNGWERVGYYLQGPSGLDAEVLVPTPYATWYETQSLAVGDLNHDGCKDIANANYNYGLVVAYGQGCQLQPDLSVAVGLTATTVSVRLAHVFGDASIEQPMITIELAVRSGAVQSSALPSNCALVSQAQRTQRIACSVDAMAPGAVETLTLPVSVTGSDTRNTLTVSVHAETGTPERSLANNRAWKQIVLPSAMQVVKRLPVAASKTARRLER